ncbi:MAG: carboxypeptidase-like regulatory domain-containing protein [Myxococcales bacterium]|nr:carboxypeptidase-like regulatory domain-containing protein [Myxococcales bacterium]
MSKRRTRRTVVALTVALCALWAIYLGLSPERSHTAVGEYQAPTKSRVARAIAERARAWQGPAAQGRPGQEAVGSVSGTVRTRDGEPLEGALVCASCADCNMTMIHNAPRCVRTDADGHYAFSGLRAGRYLLGTSSKGLGAVAANGGRPIEVRPDGSVDGDRDTELPEEGATVSGVVMDALGGVVAGAEVRLLAAGATGILKPSGVGLMVQAGQDGSFVADVPKGDVSLSAYAPGYAPGTATRAAPAAGIELVLSPASTISGQVVAEQTGQPIAGATVDARGDHGPVQQAQSDQQGRFQIEGLRPGSYQLRASAKGWIGVAMETVALDMNQSVSDVLVPMFGAVSVEGTLSVAGSPCSRGLVHVGPAGGGAGVPEETAKTNEQGLVRFEALTPGTYAVTTMCEGYGHAPAPILEVGTSPLVGVPWEMNAGAELLIRAVDEDNRPIEGAHLSAVPLTPPARSDPTGGARFGLTDETGQLILRGLGVGGYEIKHPHMIGEVRVELEAGDSVPATIRLATMGELQIEVVSPDGEPLQAVTVQATSVDGTSGAQATPVGGGMFKAGPLPTGTYLITVEDATNPRWQHPEEVPLTLEGGRVRVTYGGYTGEIAGRVLSGPDAPLRDVWVSAVAIGDRDPFAMTQQLAGRIGGTRRLTDEAGQFRLDGLNPAGVYSVTAERPSGGQAILHDVSPDGPAVELVLPAPGRLSGRMVGPDGSPIGSFRIAVRNRTTSRIGFHREFSGRDDGSWSIDHVAAGDLDVLGQDYFGRNAVASVRLEPSGHVADIALRLEKP